ncbi:hypothetical protein SMY29_001592 [Cronobacter sakazakii]|nr:hypothetical protein [Cronobacter turicensis]ELY3987580.1 hypothetical protein [Cronobacter sakazakii]
MADPLSTVLTHITNLVSFRASFRLLIIAGSIICCWIYIEPALTPLKIPSELAVTLITIIGFSIGALIAALFFGATDSLVKLITSRLNAIKERKEAEKEREAQEESNNKKIKLLINSFEEYSHYAKDILLSLTVKDCAIRLKAAPYHDYNKSFEGLLDGKIVLPLKRIDKTTTYCTINPLYKETIIELFEAKHKEEVESLFNGEFNGFEMLLAKFQEQSKPEDHIFRIENSIYENRYCYTPAIRFETYDDGEFLDNCNIQFYITDHHYPFVFEKLGGEIRHFIYGRHKPKRNQTV